MATPDGTTPAADDVVIVAGARTPTGKLLGALSAIPATDLGATAIRAALAGADVDGGDVDAVVMGQVLQAGVGQNPAKQAALAAGISPRAHTVTVNKVCLSGLTAVIDAARLLRSGEARVVVAGGMESMSQAPHLLPQLRAGQKYGDGALVDHLAHDGLTSAELHTSMGELTERHATDYPATRREQDEIALASHRRAAAAFDSGRAQRQIIPVTVTTRRGTTVVDRDEGVREDATAESLAALRPAFTAEGTITAANSSQISDGAAAVVLTTRAIAEDRGWPVLATLRAVGQVAGPDASLQDQPAAALRAALTRQDWEAADLDLVEINEAFAAVVAHSVRALGLDPDIVNPDGGAIAMGHPIGASGARLVVSAAHALHAGEATRAGVALCGGGGQGEALLLTI